MCPELFIVISCVYVSLVFSLVCMLFLFGYSLELLCVSARKYISIFCVCRSRAVWCFRRWQSSTFYQTAAAFVLGGRPPYVESQHRFLSAFRFVTVLALVLLCFPLCWFHHVQASYMHKSWCVVTVWHALFWCLMVGAITGCSELSLLVYCRWVVCCFVTFWL